MLTSECCDIGAMSGGYDFTRGSAFRGKHRALRHIEHIVLLSNSCSGTCMKVRCDIGEPRYSFRDFSQWYLKICNPQSYHSSNIKTVFCKNI